MSRKNADNKGSPDSRLIEEWLPLREINFDGDIEMAFKFISKTYHNMFKEIYGFEPRAINTVAPRIRNLHPWMARRPCGVSRALTVAALLPAGVDRKMMAQILGLDKVPNLIEDKLPPIMLYTHPNRDLLTKIVLKTCGKSPQTMVVLDPMAGGGSIPLESLRLGFKTIAMEYNPVAYIILKATLEYPAKYGEKLYEDIRNEAKILDEHAKKELGKYYATDVPRYIFARGFKCPNCYGLVPIIHNTQLGMDGPYIKFNFDRNKKTFTVKIVDHETEFEKLRCPYCSRPLTIDEVIKNWIIKHKQLLNYAINGDKEKVRTSTEELLEVHIPLVKQTQKGFTSCNDEDKQAFVNAFMDFSLQIKELRSYVPNALIPPENEVFEPVKECGTEYWYQLFNPRQLLVLAKLIKYVSDRAHELIQKKGEYGAILATYLALGISKITNYNNVATTWHSTRSVIRDLAGHYASSKNVGFGLDYCEVNIAWTKLAMTQWVFEPDVEKRTSTSGGTCPVVRELCSWINELGDRIEVYMGDAREMSKILGEGSVDVVNVDPPYFDQHNYSDLSEFFWQVLKLALKPAIDSGYLFNRDKKRGMVECLVSGWSPVLSTVPRSEEIIVRKSRKGRSGEEAQSEKWYEEQMWRFFSEVQKVLKDDGVLIVWYTHSDPKAWEATLGALYASNLTINRIWVVRTEMGQRRVALAGSAFFTSVALVARKKTDRIVVGEKESKTLASNSQVRDAIVNSAVEALRCAEQSGASEREAYIMSIAGAIAGATKVHNPLIEEITEKEIEMRGLDKYIETSDKGREDQLAKLRFENMSGFFKNQLYPIALFLGANKVLEEKLADAGLSPEEARLVVGGDNDTTAFLILWLSTRIAEESRIDYDFAEKICKVLGTRPSFLVMRGLLLKAKGGTYSVPYGQEAIDAVKNKLEKLDTTAAGKAMLLTNLIVESPIKDDVDRCVRYILTKKPVGRQEAIIALFLLKTARPDEIRKAGIPEILKPFAEKVLKKLSEG
jgi:adenine-specific DNA methylase